MKHFSLVNILLAISVFANGVLILLMLVLTPVQSQDFDAAYSINTKGPSGSLGLRTKSGSNNCLSQLRANTFEGVDVSWREARALLINDSYRRFLNSSDNDNLLIGSLASGILKLSSEEESICNEELLKLLSAIEAQDVTAFEQRSSEKGDYINSVGYDIGPMIERFQEAVAQYVGKERAEIMTELVFSDQIFKHRGLPTEIFVIQEDGKIPMLSVTVKNEFGDIVDSQISSFADSTSHRFQYSHLVVIGAWSAHVQENPSQQQVADEKALRDPNSALPTLR